jgi:DNA repair protein RAD50
MDSLRTNDISDLENTAKEHEQSQNRAIEQMEKVKSPRKSIRPPPLLTALLYLLSFKVAVEMSQAQGGRSRIERIYKLSEDAVRQHQESKQLEKDIGRLESELRCTGSTRTITDCKRELEDLADQR